MYARERGSAGSSISTSPAERTQFRAGVGDVIPGGRRLVIAQANAEGIEPRVKFQSAAVALGDGERQGIVIRLRREAHFACQECRPRLQFGIVQRVAAGADLEDDGVQVQLDGAVEDGNQLGFLPAGGQARTGGPIQILEARHPEAANSRSGAGGTEVESAARDGRAASGSSVTRGDELPQPARSRSVNRAIWLILAVINGSGHTNTRHKGGWEAFFLGDWLGREVELSETWWKG